MFCSQCGHTLADQAPFCTQCGTRQKAPSGPPSGAAAQAPRPAPPPPAQPHSGYAPPPPQPAPVHAHAYAPAPHPGLAGATNGLCPPLTTGQFLGIFLLMCVPLLGFILLLVWAFGDGSGNPNRKNYARAMLLMQVIACVILVVGTVIAFLAQKAG